MQKREIQVMIKSMKTNQRRISLMDYCIRNLLELTDKNWLETVIENHEIIHKVKGTWTNTCASCLYCFSKNVIKHSHMEHKIRIPRLFGSKTILDLKVQRFICKDCCKTWVADCPLVPKNSNISYDLACQIMSMSLKKGHKSVYCTPKVRHKKSNFWGVF